MPATRHRKTFSCRFLKEIRQANSEGRWYKISTDLARKLSLAWTRRSWWTQQHSRLVTQDDISTLDNVIHMNSHTRICTDSIRIHELNEFMFLQETRWLCRTKLGTGVFYLHCHSFLKYLRVTPLSPFLFCSAPISRRTQGQAPAKPRESTCTFSTSNFCFGSASNSNARNTSSIL